MLVSIIHGNTPIRVSPDLRRSVITALGMIRSARNRTGKKRLVCVSCSAVVHKIDVKSRCTDCSANASAKAKKAWETRRKNARAKTSKVKASKPRRQRPRDVLKRNDAPWSF